MKTFRSALVLLLLVCFGQSFWAQAKVKTPPPPDYFPLRTGDWWKYKLTYGDKTNEFTMKVVSAEKTSDGAVLYLVETKTPTSVSQEWYSKGEGWVLTHKVAYPDTNMSGEYTPVRKFLENPPGKDTAWEWKGTHMNIDSDEKNKVIGSEVVEVPAGKFSAVRVDTDVLQGTATIKKSMWYANWIGFVKSVVDSSGLKSTVELEDYSFKPKPR